MNRSAAVFCLGVVIALQLTSCQLSKVLSGTVSSLQKESATPQPEITPYFEPQNENLRYGFVDRTGQFVIPAKFRSASCFKGGLAPVTTSEGNTYIDKSGRYLVKPGDYLTYHSGNCDDIWPNYVEGLHIIRRDIQSSTSQDGKHVSEIKRYYGYVNMQGTVVIPLTQYLSVEDFSDGMAKVYLLTEATSDEIEAAKRRGAGPKPGTKVGYIDTTGKLVIPAKFDEAEGFRWGIAKVRVEWYKPDPDNPGQKKTITTYGFIDKQGRYLVKPTTDLSNSTYGCKISDQLIKNSQILMGKDALSKESPAIKQLCDSPDSAITRDGFVLSDLDLLPSSDVDQVLKNQAGKQLFPGKRSEVNPYYQRLDTGINEGLALIERDDGYKCFINNQGKFVIPCKYKDASAFSEGVAAVAVEIDPKQK
jgi:WG containing repeat